mgnify:CR=1 FL=1
MSASNFRIKKICTHCNKEFEAQKFSTKYCSQICAARAYKFRMRKGVVEVSNEETERIKSKPIEDLKAKDFLSIAETCQLLGVSRWTIWRAINANKISPAKMGKRIIIRRSEIDNLFKQEALPEPRVQVKTQPVSIQPNESECYNLTEVQMKFGISEKALYDVIKRNNIFKFRKGAFAYVPKIDIDNLFKSYNHASNTKEENALRR